MLAMTTAGSRTSFRVDPSRSALLLKGASHAYPYDYQCPTNSLSYVNEQCVLWYAIADTSEGGDQL
jgi:hypothetical protein